LIRSGVALFAGVVYGDIHPTFKQKAGFLFFPRLIHRVRFALPGM
jgi:hypothetical protein